MCILCVASRWSRRIVTMLPWLIIPLIILWALSQLLPPGFRFEVTSPRLACVGVLLFSLGWYELLMPRLSEWRARRSLMLHEKRKIEAQEAAKWRKEAIRKCRNCFMAYKDQKPVGGKFMCTYCGHLSKRPALDVPGGAQSMGIGHFIGRKDLRMQGNKSWTERMFENDLWPGVWGMGSANESCIIGGQNSGVLIVFRLVSFVGFCIWWACSKVWRGSMSDGDRLRTERKNGQRKGEDGGCQESKVEKLRRKAEEKRLARLEKEQMEAEERMQREEVARLVDERRKQRADAQKDNEMEANTEDGDREQDIERRKQEKPNDKVKEPAKVKNNSQDDPKKNKEKGKKDKKPEDTKVAKSVESTVKAESPNLVRGTNTTSMKTTSVGKSGVYTASKYQFIKGRSPALLTSKKQDKPVSNAVTTGNTSITKVSSTDGIVNKPSAWNRISWAWGKGNAARTSTSSEKQELSRETPDYAACKDVEPSLVVTGTAQNSPVLSPSKVSPSPVEPAEPVVQLPPPLLDISLSQPVSPAVVDDSLSATFPTTLKLPPVSAPLVCENVSVLPPVDTPAVSPQYESSVSMYSTFMPPPAVNAPVSDAPAYDSTWKMWEAPNLELPRLTQLNDGLSLHPAPKTNSILPNKRLNNNLWSNVHALESARRIWEDSESTPPEFVDCITQEVMKDPVIAADGHSYERSAIETWLRTHDTSPKTGEVLPSLGSGGGGVDKSLRPNHNLRGQIIEYRECMQRGLVPATNGWQSTTEGLKKGHIGGLYTPPGVGSVWAFSSS